MQYQPNYSLRHELTSAICVGASFGMGYGMLANHSLGQCIIDLAVGGAVAGGLGGLILGLNRIARGNRHEETIDAAVADQRSTSPNSE